MAAANRYLEESFWPHMNRRFGVDATAPGSSIVPLGDVDLDSRTAARTRPALAHLEGAEPPGSSSTRRRLAAPRWNTLTLTNDRIDEPREQLSVTRSTPVAVE